MTSAEYSPAVLRTRPVATGHWRAFLAVAEDQAGRGDVEAEAQQGGDQQQAGEGAELQGLLGVDADQQDDQRQRQVDDAARQAGLLERQIEQAQRITAVGGVDVGVAEDVVQLRDFERRAGIGQQGRRAQPRQLRDGDEGDAPCFTRPVEGREACRNTAEYVAARGHQRMKLASAMATAASTTTAPRRATQTSWRPRIVSGSTLSVARL